MTNTFIFPEVYSKEYQHTWTKQNVSSAICNWGYKAQLGRGDTFSRVYADISDDVYTYARGTDMTREDVTDTKEQLTVSSEFYKAIYIDNFDKIQDNKNAAVKYGNLMSVKLKNQVDADVLGEVSNATNTVDDGTIGGTGGNGIALSTTNLPKVIGAVRKYLRKENVPLDGMVGIVSPEFEDTLTQYLSGRETSGGDTVTSNGRIGTYLGVTFYVSNQTSTSASLSMATDVTDGDTATVNGVVATFVSSLGSTANNVLIGANVDATRANYEAFINGSSGAGSTYVEASASDRRKLRNATATNDDTANTLVVVYKGVGVLAVSETLTDGTDQWTATLEKQLLMFGKKGAVSGIMQASPMVKFTQPELRNGKNLLNTSLYGLKSFNDGKPQMVKVEIKSSTY